MIISKQTIKLVHRHNLLRDVWQDSCHLAHLGVKVEVGNNLTHDHDHTRPADVLVHNWSLGKPAAFDFCVTSPLIHLSFRKRECLRERLLMHLKSESTTTMMPNVGNYDGFASHWLLRQRCMGSRGCQKFCSVGI